MIAPDSPNWAAVILAVAIFAFVGWVIADVTMLSAEPATTIAPPAYVVVEPVTVAP